MNEKDGGRMSREQTDNIMYEVDEDFLADAVRQALRELHRVIAEETDYVGAQITFDDVHEGYKPKLHVIVARQE